VGSTPNFWAAPFEVDGEFGGLGQPDPFPPDAIQLRYKRQNHAATTLVVVATDVALTKAEAKRMAIMAHDGFARALWPSHTPFDGDLVFALSTGRSRRHRGFVDLIEIGSAAAACVCRAIARGVYEATTSPNDRVSTWQARFAG
jgi:L-aminopeptidase/D-esterase-like protein